MADLSPPPGVRLPTFKRPGASPEPGSKRMPMKNAALESSGRVLADALERSLSRASAAQALAGGGDLGMKQSKYAEGTAARAREQAEEDASPPGRKPRVAVLSPHPPALSPIAENIPAGLAKGPVAPPVVLSQVMFKLGGPLPGA